MNMKIRKKILTEIADDVEKATTLEEVKTALIQAIFILDSDYATHDDVEDYVYPRD